MVRQPRQLLETCVSDESSSTTNKQVPSPQDYHGLDGNVDNLNDIVASVVLLIVVAPAQPLLSASTSCRFGPLARGQHVGTVPFWYLLSTIGLDLQRHTCTHCSSDI